MCQVCKRPCVCPCPASQEAQGCHRCLPPRLSSLHSARALANSWPHLWSSKTRAAAARVPRAQAAHSSCSSRQSVAGKCPYKGFGDSRGRDLARKPWRSRPGHKEEIVQRQRRRHSIFTIQGHYNWDFTEFCVPGPCRSLWHRLPNALLAPFPEHAGGRIWRRAH